MRCARATATGRRWCAAAGSVWSWRRAAIWTAICSLPRCPAAAHWPPDPDSPGSSPTATPASPSSQPTGPSRDRATEVDAHPPIACAGRAQPRAPPPRPARRRGLPRPRRSRQRLRQRRDHRHHGHPAADGGRHPRRRRRHQPADGRAVRPGVGERRSRASCARTRSATVPRTGTPPSRDPCRSSRRRPATCSPTCTRSAPRRSRPPPPSPRRRARSTRRRSPVRPPPRPSRWTPRRPPRRRCRPTHAPSTIRSP